MLSLVKDDERLHSYKGATRPKLQNVVADHAKAVLTRTRVQGMGVQGVVEGWHVL